jgi:hypothetical protein
MNWYIFGAVYFVGFLVSLFVWAIGLACYEKRKMCSICVGDYLASLIWPLMMVAFILAIVIVSIRDKKIFDFKNPFYKVKE